MHPVLYFAKIKFLLKDIDTQTVFLLKKNKPGSNNTKVQYYEYI